MMALGFGHGTHLVDEGQGLREVFEGIQSFEMAFRAQATTRGRVPSITPVPDQWEEGAHRRGRGYICCQQDP